MGSGLFWSQIHHPDNGISCEHSTVQTEIIGILHFEVKVIDTFIGTKNYKL